jgi:nicotinamidase/pyrazinamidase
MAKQEPALRAGQDRPSDRRILSTSYARPVMPPGKSATQARTAVMRAGKAATAQAGTARGPGSGAPATEPRTSPTRTSPAQTPGGAPSEAPAGEPRASRGPSTIPAPYDARTALIVVDVQNDFADPGGSLAVKGGVRVAERSSAEARRASQAEAFVVYTQDWHPPSTPHFAKDGGIWPVHCVAGTWGAELHPALEVLGPTVRKGVNGEDGYSGFTMRDPVSGATIPTELEALLHERGIERVVICGLATDYCVNATALDARRLGFRTEVLADAVAGVNLRPGDDRRAVAEMTDAGCTVVVPSRRSAVSNAPGSAAGTGTSMGTGAGAGSAAGQREA